MRKAENALKERQSRLVVFLAVIVAYALAEALPGHFRLPIRLRLSDTDAKTERE